jgi:hypothetical protein
LFQFGQERAGARDQFAALLSVWERMLSTEHPQTPATRGSLAYRTGQAESDTGRPGLD